MKKPYASHTALLLALLLLGPLMLVPTACVKEKVLPVITITGFPEIKSRTALCNAVVESDGGQKILTRGVCWWTQPGPTIERDSTQNGAGLGAFTARMNGLVERTRYYVRGYVTSAAGTSYGIESSFTTLIGDNLPVVVTTAPFNINLTDAQSGGDVLSEGSGPVSVKGICWKTTPGASIADDTTVDGSGLGSFVSTMWGLTLNTTYFVRAYATSQVGTGYGQELSFTTGTTTPTVVTTPILNTTSTMAPGGGEVLSDGGAPVTSRGVCWNTAGTPVYPTDSNRLSGTGLGVFSVDLTNLTPSTQYYARAFAVNSVGTGYGQQEEFVTQAASLPTVVIDSVGFNVGHHIVPCFGTVITDGGAPLTGKGFYLDTIAYASPALASGPVNPPGGPGPFNRVTFLYNVQTPPGIRGELNGRNLFAWAYAVNGVGVATSPTAIPVKTKVYDTDSNMYNWTTIGTQDWLTENLRTTRYCNGNNITQIASPAGWAAAAGGAWSHYDNQAVNDTIYGKLYNGLAAADARNACPCGWRVPTDADWTTLENFVGGPTQAGGALKQTGTALWNAPNTGATNAQGFNGRPGGYRTNTSSGGFVNVQQDAYWWSQTQPTGTPLDLFYRKAIYNSAALERNPNNRLFGFSVRCMRPTRP